MRKSIIVNGKKMYKINKLKAGVEGKTERRKKNITKRIFSRVLERKKKSTAMDTQREVYKLVAKRFFFF